MGARPGAEYFEDQPGPVDDFGLPASFQVALLHRAQGSVDDHQPDLVVADQRAEIFNGAAAEQTAWARAADPGDLGTDDIETDRPGEPDRFFEPRFGCTAGNFGCMAPKRGLRDRVDDQGSAGRSLGCRCGFCSAQDSAISLFGSNSWIGCPGITVEIACLYTS